MTEYGGLRQEIATRADAADADPERAAGLKSLAAQLWANFDEFTVEELEDTDGRDPGGVTSLGHAGGNKFLSHSSTAWRRTTMANDQWHMPVVLELHAVGQYRTISCNAEASTVFGIDGQAKTIARTAMRFWSV